MTAATTQTATIHDAQTMTGAQVVIQALVEQGVEVIFGYPGRRGAAALRRAVPAGQDPPHPGPPRAGRRARGRGLCPLDRQGRRRAGHLRPGCDQHRHRPHRRADGFGAAGLPDRPGADPHDRQRRLPGGRHGRHHPALHQAQLSGQAAGGSGPGHARGVPCRPLRPARPGRGRPAQEHPDGQGALFRRRTRSSTAPTTRAPSPTPPGSRRRPSCWPAPSGRSSMSAAASSTPGPRPAPS